MRVSMAVNGSVRTLTVEPDDRFLYATNFGYSNLTSFQIDSGELTVAKVPYNSPQSLAGF